MMFQIYFTIPTYIYNNWLKQSTEYYWPSTTICRYYVLNICSTILQKIHDLHILCVTFGPRGKFMKICFGKQSILIETKAGSRYPPLSF